MLFLSHFHYILLTSPLLCSHILYLPIVNGLGRRGDGGSRAANYPKHVASASHAEALRT